MSVPKEETVELRVVGVRAEPAAMALKIGTPIQPFSVGASGQWVVAAEGVGPVHFFLGFDGHQVYVVAASPSLPVQLGSQPIGGTWVAAPAPCDIRFGRASLWIRRVPGVLSANHEAVPSTVSDGGALREAAQRVAHPHGSRPPLAGAPKNFGATMLMPPPGGGLGNVAVHEPAVPAVPESAAPAGPEPAAPVQPPTILAGWPSELSARVDVEETADPDKVKGGYWQSASVVKKITVVLMPLSLVAALLMLRDSRQPEATPPSSRPAAASAPLSLGTGAPLRAAAPARATAVAAAIPPPPDPSSASAAQRPVGPVASKGRPLAAPARASSRSPEREALEAVAAGSFEDAARQYDVLAASHPDDPNFKEAARILHAKASRVH